MSPHTLLIFVLSAAVAFGLGVRLLAPADTVTLDRADWVCTDKEPDGCAEWRRDHDHQMRGREGKR